PIIFMTAYGDGPMSVQAIKGGALEFFTKPGRYQDLLDAIHLGLERDRARRETDKRPSALRRTPPAALCGIPDLSRPDAREGPTAHPIQNQSSLPKGLQACVPRS